MRVLKLQHSSVLFNVVSTRFQFKWKFAHIGFIAYGSHSGFCTRFLSARARLFLLNSDGVFSRIVNIHTIRCEHFRQQLTSMHKSQNNESHSATKEEWPKHFYGPVLSCNFLYEVVVGFSVIVVSESGPRNHSKNMHTNNQ